MFLKSPSTTRSLSIDRSFRRQIIHVPSLLIALINASSVLTIDADVTASALGDAPGDALGEALTVGLGDALGLTLGDAVGVGLGFGVVVVQPATSAASIMTHSMAANKDFTLINILLVKHSFRCIQIIRTTAANHVWLYFFIHFTDSL